MGAASSLSTFSVRNRKWLTPPAWDRRSLHAFSSPVLRPLLIVFAGRNHGQPATRSKRSSTKVCDSSSMALILRATPLRRSEVLRAQASGSQVREFVQKIDLRVEPS